MNQNYNEVGTWSLNISTKNQLLLMASKCGNNTISEPAEVGTSSTTWPVRETLPHNNLFQNSVFFFCFSISTKSQQQTSNNFQVFVTHFQKQRVLDCTLLLVIKTHICQDRLVNYDAQITHITCERG